MALPDKHPDYVNYLGTWIQMDDTYNGERAVKTKRLDYLPATEGMIQDGMTTPSAPGWKDYEAYLLRAVYRDFVKDAVKAMIGVLHEKPATFTLTPKLKDMAQNSTIAGESLQQLLRRINVQQLVKGRIGLLLDAPTGKDVNTALPYIATYDALRVINWDAGKLNEGRNTLQLVVLDESDYRREGFTWKTERKYRVLTRGIPESLESGWETPDGTADFAVAVKVNDSSTPVSQDFLVPQIGGRKLKEIPFVFCNANDLVPEPEVPPLLGLSNLSLAIYRAEADYRQTLFLQGQNTLVLIGVDDDDDDDSDGQPIRVGNKGVIKMKLEGDAKYIGVSASGLGEMRQSLENDRRDAAFEGVNFLSGGNGADRAESGEALRIRVAARTTTIKGIAITAAQALTQMLRWAAEWVGDNPDEIKVEVPSDFADSSVQGAMLLAFMQAKQLGLPLSLRSLHRMMRSNDMTELSFDEENEQIEAEAETMLGMMVGPQLMNVDDNWLDSDNPAIADPAAGATAPTAAPAGGVSPTADPNDPGNQVSTPGQPKSGPASTAPKNSNTPVTPHARAKGHLRGSPTPLKKKSPHKGSTAGKKH